MMSAQAYELDDYKYLDFSEIEMLAGLDDRVSPEAISKLKHILNRPMVLRGRAGPGWQNQRALKVIHWNIERGFNIDAIRRLYQEQSPVLVADTGVMNKLREEIEILQSVDILTLNEVDLGIGRTDFRNVAAELAEMLNGDYAFAPEFLELESSLLDIPKPERLKYKGLHGNAIVSRYPIVAAKILRLPLCYDWYKGEAHKISLLERSKRKVAKTVVDEKILTELRRGNRNALVVDVRLPNEQVIKVVSTHLENRSSAKCREQQMNVLLEELRSASVPVILGADLNAFESDASPTSVTKSFKSKLTDLSFLTRQTLAWLNPLGWALNLSSMLVGKVRKYKDPTVASVPVFFPNKAAKLFKMIRKFEFVDDIGFDDASDGEWRYGGRGSWANSNERGRKGFVETFSLNRSFKLINFKIDWLFVKNIKNKRGKKKYFPAFARTLKLLNQHGIEGEEKVSDHNAVSLDVII